MSSCQLATPDQNHKMLHPKPDEWLGMVIGQCLEYQFGPTHRSDRQKYHINPHKYTQPIHQKNQPTNHQLAPGWERGRGGERRRINTEEKAKVVTAVWGQDLLNSLPC